MMFFYSKEAFPQIINYKKAFNLLETQKHASNFKIMILIIKINYCHLKKKGFLFVFVFVIYIHYNI